MNRTEIWWLVLALGSDLLEWQPKLLTGHLSSLFCSIKTLVFIIKFLKD
jgi:hypothetical protein